MLNAILLVFGAIMLWAGWQGFKEQRRLLTRGVQTKARVVEVKEFHDAGHRYFSPVWAFEDEAGNEYRLPMLFSNERSTSRSRYKIGDTMRIVYDPDSPDRVQGVGAKQNIGLLIYILVSAGLIAYVVADLFGLWG